MICSAVHESRFTDFTLEICTPRLRWKPAQRIQMKTPIFQLAHRGSKDLHQILRVSFAPLLFVSQSTQYLLSSSLSIWARVIWYFSCIFNFARSHRPAIEIQLIGKREKRELFQVKSTSEQIIAQWQTVKYKSDRSCFIGSHPTTNLSDMRRCRHMSTREEGIVHEWVQKIFYSKESMRKSSAQTRYRQCSVNLTRHVDIHSNTTHT